MIALLFLYGCSESMVTPENASKSVVMSHDIIGLYPEDSAIILPDTAVEDEEEEQEPEVPMGCDADLSLVEAEQGFGTYQIQDHDIVVSSDGRLNIFTQGTYLFESPQNKWLQVGKRTLNISENQGSFSIEQQEDYTCSEFVPTEVRYEREALWLTGNVEGDDCQPSTVDITFCQPSPNRLSISITSRNPEIDHINLRMVSDASERIYGMGEQFPHNDLNLKGRNIPVIVQEGGVGRGHVPISPTVNAVSPGSSGSENSTYYVAPHFLSNKNRSVFLEDSSYSEFDFQNPDEISISLFANEMNANLVYGDSPLSMITTFTDYAGRMPPPPEWVNNGAIIALARPLDQSQQIISDLQDYDVQIAGVWNQTWSGIQTTFIGEQVLWNWEQNETAHPTWKTWVDDLAEENIRVLCYVNPMFVDVEGLDSSINRNLFQEGIEQDFFVLDHEGDTLLSEVTAFSVALLDLTNEDARQWMKNILLTEMIEEAQCSGWMADFAEALPFDAKLHSGTSAESFHNLYPVEWIKLNREAIEEAGKLGEIFVFNRSGFTTTPRYSLSLWQGDQLTTWDKYDGLKSAIHGLLNGGFSGISINHSDIGGYTSLARYGIGYERKKELLMRWTEFSAFTAIMRTHEGNQPEINAQIYSDDEAMEHFAKMTKIYKSLAFYRTELFHQANQYGWPVVRHMMLHYPTDPSAYEQHKQFLLGEDILVAPTYNKCFIPWGCQYNKDVYLPAGEWTHLWSQQTYTGPVDTTVDAPLGEPAVFYKANSVVGQQFVDNLKDYGIIVQ